MKTVLGWLKALGMSVLLLLPTILMTVGFIVIPEVMVPAVLIALFGGVVYLTHSIQESNK